MIFVSTDILKVYDRKIVSQDHYATVIDFLQDKYPNGFDRPTDISINGNMLLVDDYDTKLNEYDIVVLLDRSALPVGLIGGWFITALANLAISVTLSYVANKLFAPDEASAKAEPSSVYNLNSAQNSASYGNPIPIIYGKVRMYPSMIVEPYYKYIDDIEYLYHVLCVGQGTNTTDAILLANNESTAEDVEWKLLYQDDFYNIPLNGYGVHITNTLASPSNMELRMDELSSRNQIKIGTQFMEFDYKFPAGIYSTNSDGSFGAALVTITYYLHIEVGGVYAEVYQSTFVTTGASDEPIQKTIRQDVTAWTDTQPVYISFKKHFRSVKTKDTENTYITRVKEIYPNEDFTNLYGDITLLVCKIKATNAVSTAGQVKVNGYFERTDVGNTMAEVLTDIYTNTTYGGGLSIDDLDFPATTETVNCAYEENITIFDAMRKPALAQGYSVYLAGMDVILKKDGANAVTSGMYNEMNILQNSLKVQYLFKEEFPTYDGFECTYIDADWTPQTKLYPHTSIRPKKVDLFGCADVTTPDPILLEADSIHTTSMQTTRGVATKGTTAFTTSYGNNNLTSFDISNPTDIKQLGNYTLQGTTSPRGIDISGDVAYIVGYSADSIIAVDISNPSTMSRISVLSDAINLNGSDYLKISGTVAYVVSILANSITAVDISDPSSMQVLDSYSAGSMSQPQGLAISGDVAYVTAKQSDSITAIDISDPSNLTQLDVFTHNTYLNGAMGIAISGTTAYVANENDHSVTNIDISDPSNLTYISTFKTSSIYGAKDVVISNNTAYVSSNWSQTITSLNIIDKQNIQKLASYTNGQSLSGAWGLNINDGVLYVAGEGNATLTSIATVDSSKHVPTIAQVMATYLYKQDEARRKIVTFSTDIQGLIPQFLDKIMVSHNGLQWGEAGEVYSRNLDDLVISDKLVDLSAGKTIVFRDVDGSVSIAYSVTIVDEYNITVVGMPAWVTANTFYTTQEAGTAREFLVIAVKPSGNSVQIDCVNYSEEIYI